MRKTITSRKEILENCQDLVSEKGLTAIDIRTVAAACHVSVGSIYNHFESKDDLIYGVLDYAWEKIFDLGEIDKDKSGSFLNYLEWLFLYSLGLAYKDPKQGRDLFDEHTAPLKEGLLKAWEDDPKLGDSYLNEDSKGKIDFLFTSLIGTLLTESISKEDFIKLASNYIQTIE